MKFECKYLEQDIINDLFDMESKGAKGFIARQVGRFLSEIPDHLSGIESGIEVKDFDSIRHHSHKLNGFSGTLGAYKIREVAMLIEKASIDKAPNEMPDLFEELKDIVDLCSPELREIARISERNNPSDGT